MRLDHTFWLTITLDRQEKVVLVQGSGKTRNDGKGNGNGNGNANSLAVPLSDQLSLNFNNHKPPSIPGVNNSLHAEVIYTFQFSNVESTQRYGHMQDIRLHTRVVIAPRAKFRFEAVAQMVL